MKRRLPLNAKIMLWLCVMYVVVVFGVTLLIVYLEQPSLLETTHAQCN